MEINELLDLAKTRANLPSDYALAKVLGIATGNLSNIRKGRNHPSNEEAVKLAHLAGLEEMRVIAEIELRTANSEKKKEFWKNFIESRGLAHSLGTIALGLSILAIPEPAEATALHLQNYDAPFCAHNNNHIYIMRIDIKSNSGIFQCLWYASAIANQTFDSHSALL